MRTLSAGMQTAVDAAHAQVVLFVKADFDAGDGGTQYYCTAGASIAWNGFTWLGTGGLVSVEPLRETAAIESVGLRMTLSGVPSSLLSLALGSHVQGRLLTVWMGALDSSNALISSPLQVYAGRIDTLTIEDGEQTATITATVESEMAALMSAAVRRYTNEDQQRAYPGDKVFEYVPQMVEKVLPFPSREAQQ